MRLHEGSVQGLHSLAAILASVMTLFRAGHAVTTLHCLIGRGSSEAVKRVDRERHNQQHHENWPSKVHYLEEYMLKGGPCQETGTRVQLLGNRL